MKFLLFTYLLLVQMLTDRKKNPLRTLLEIEVNPVCPRSLDPFLVLYEMCECMKFKSKFDGFPFYMVKPKIKKIYAFRRGSCGIHWKSPPPPQKNHSCIFFGGGEDDFFGLPKQEFCICLIKKNFSSLVFFTMFLPIK